MEVAGNFCLKDALFPSCLGDSVKLAEQGYHIPTYKVKATESTGGSVSSLQGTLAEAFSQT